MDRGDTPTLRQGKSRTKNVRGRAEEDGPRGCSEVKGVCLGALVLCARVSIRSHGRCISNRITEGELRSLPCPNLRSHCKVMLFPSGNPDVDAFRHHVDACDILYLLDESLLHRNTLHEFCRSVTRVLTRMFLLAPVLLSAKSVDMPEPILRYPALSM